MVFLGIWFLPSQKPQPESIDVINQPTSPRAGITQQGPVPDQKADAGTQADIAAAFHSQTATSTGATVTLQGTVIVSTYALQTWKEGDEAGEALFKYTSGTGWKLVTSGGGEASVASLITIGIPQDIAEALIAGRK